MKEYILTIIGASLLSSITNIISSEKWKPYIRIVTGLVVISVILAPVAAIRNINIFSDFKIPEEYIVQGESRQHAEVAEELIKKIGSDVEERLKNEFNINAEAEVTLKLNSELKIERVDRIYIHTKFLPKKVIDRLAEVYGVSRNEVITDE